MNLDNVFRQLEGLSKDTKEMVLRWIISSTQAAASTEKSLLSNVTDDRDQAKMTQAYKADTSKLLSNDFVAGKVTEATKEYAKRFNLILEKSKEIEMYFDPSSIRFDDDGNVTIDKQKLYLTEQQYNAKMNRGTHVNRETILLSVENKVELLNDNQYVEIKAGLVEPKLVVLIIHFL